MSPDLDAIGSVWVIKKFLPGWKDADVEFVPAGLRSEKVKRVSDFESQSIITVGDYEVIQVLAHLIIIKPQLRIPAVQNGPGNLYCPY